MAKQQQQHRWWHDFGSYIWLSQGDRQHSASPRTLEVGVPARHDSISRTRLLLTCLTSKVGISARRMQLFIIL
jgi:hypothetical protein